MPNSVPLAAGDVKAVDPRPITRGAPSGARQEKSAPILAALKPWLSARLELISQKSDLAKAIRYTLSHWDGLSRLLDDGRIGRRFIRSRRYP